MSMRHGFGLGLRMTAASLALMAATSARAGTLGTEFQVNTYTSLNQYQIGRAICLAADGDFVVVWHSDANQDGNGQGIFGQRYVSSGTPNGTEFQVNTYTSGYQSDPAVCCQADGDFVVTWTDGSFNGSIRAQRFASSGAFLGTEFQVNGYTAAGSNSDICCAADGDFVVVWSNYTGLVSGRRFASGGAPQGTEFQVSTYTGLSLEPGVCCDAAGDFVVAWSEYRPGSGVFDFDVFARRYASNGAARGTEFQVNTYTTGFQGQSTRRNAENQAICCDQAGDFTVAWQFQANTYTFIDTEIHAQRFTSTGAFRGEEFQVNAHTAAYQRSPAACCGAKGDFVIVWAGSSSESSYGGLSIFGRSFGSTGAPLTGDFQVNTYTGGGMYYPTNACAPDGSFVVSWSQYPGEDGSRAGVFAQRFLPPALVPTPALSWVGLASVVAGLLGVGFGAFRRRK